MISVAPQFAPQLVKLYVDCLEGKLIPRVIYTPKKRYTTLKETFCHYFTKMVPMNDDDDSSDQMCDMDTVFHTINDMFHSVGKENFRKPQTRSRTTFMGHVDKFVMALGRAIENHLHASENDDETDDDDDDEEYVPSDEEESEYDDDDENDDEDEAEDDGEAEDDAEAEDDDEVEDDDEAEKVFGCEGCQYEWRDGWQKGWKSAMKKINKFTKQQKRPENIHIPECAYCGALHNLKKCGGKCNGAVRYCSTKCQKKDWKQEHSEMCVS